MGVVRNDDGVEEERRRRRRRREGGRWKSGVEAKGKAQRSNEAGAGGSKLWHLAHLARDHGFPMRPACDEEERQRRKKVEEDGERSQRGDKRLRGDEGEGEEVRVKEICAVKLRGEVAR